jgi:hypothetical protein
MNEQEFHNWYKRLIENSQEMPPEQVWENIQLHLDRDFYDWYRRQVEDPVEEPPDAVWNNIEDKLDKDFNQAIAAGITGTGEEPPEAVWENIEKELDQDFTQWYRAGIENPSAEPPESLWNNIQDELDVDDTWQRIHERMERSGKKRKLYMTWASAAVILLLVTLALQVFLPVRDTSILEDARQKQVATEQPEATPAEPAGEQEEQASQPTKPIDPVREGIEKQPVQASIMTPTSIEPDTTAADQRQPMQSVPDAEQILLAKADPISVKLDARENISRSALASVPTRDQEVEIQPEKDFRPRNFYVGLSGELGNSWLLSNKTIYSIRNSPYSAASPERGKAYGLMAGASLNDRLDIQMEALFTNENGQKYKEYTDGQVVNNQIQLNYSSLKITGRYEIIQSSFQLPLSHHVVLGTYGSYLKDAQRQTDGASENIKPAYKNYNLGLIVGYDLDTQIAPRYTLSAGLRFNPGVVNIYDGTTMLPARFNRTYSSSVNINISLKYNLSRL